MHLLLQKNRKKDFVTEERLNKELLTDESIRYLYKSRLEGIINENPLTEEDVIDDNWEKLKTNILRAGKEALGTRRAKIPPQTHKKTPRFCDRTASVAGRKRKDFVHFRSSRTLNSYNNIKR